MNPISKKIVPFLLIVFGFLILINIKEPISAGACILVGIIMIVESIWPEKWGIEK